MFPHNFSNKMQKHKFVSLGKLLAIIIVFNVLQTKTVPIDSETQAMRYLTRFGYLNSENGVIIEMTDKQRFRKAISEFQNITGLEVTGQLNDDTIKIMSMPRCGVKDKIGFDSNYRLKRYVHTKSKWAKENLTYNISKYSMTSKLTPDEIDSEIKRAFDLWADYTILTFTHVRDGNVDINIRFEIGDHGDLNPFDGRKKKDNILAHANLPPHAGEIHFDDDEIWTMGSSSGINLFQVAAHEIGHTLGLDHSNVTSALMYSIYKNYDPTLSLDIDDINGIQELYGHTTFFSLCFSPTCLIEINLCTDPKIDTIFSNAKGETFIFKGKVYHKLTEDGIEPGFPKLIWETWRWLPGNIDAAFTYNNKKTYFFKGSKYWKYDGTKMDGNYPREISEGFPGIPNNIDAAFVWSGNGKMYFFKEDKYWRYDPNAIKPIKSSYPQRIVYWKGIPNNVDAAFKYTDGRTYFFKNDFYYKFNDANFSVNQNEDEVPFPRSISYRWFGCKSTSSVTSSPQSLNSTEPTIDDENEVYMDN